MARSRRPHPLSTPATTPPVHRKQATIAAVRAGEDQALDERIRKIAREVANEEIDRRESDRLHDSQRGE